MSSRTIITNRRCGRCNRIEDESNVLLCEKCNTDVCDSCFDPDKHDSYFGSYYSHEIKNDGFSGYYKYNEEDYKIDKENFKCILCENVK